MVETTKGRLEGVERGDSPRRRAEAADSGCRMGSSDSMEDKGNDNKGGNRGNHSNKGRSKGGRGASDRPEKCSEGRMS
eukprot:6238176-Pyramimonas_sp.AAC.1